jgi:hypothetical protein
MIHSFIFVKIIALDLLNYMYASFYTYRFTILPADFPMKLAAHKRHP